MTETLTRLFALEAVPDDWGHFDCQRLATAAEMAAHPNCGDCGQLLVAKVGGGVVQGTVIGRRTDRTHQWEWTLPLCHDCEKLAAIADGI